MNTSISNIVQLEHLWLPHSNAETERAFSVARDVKTKKE